MSGTLPKKLLPAAVRAATPKLFGNFKFLEYTKREKWPNQALMQSSPTITLLQFQSKPGKEAELERELVDALESAKTRAGVKKVAVYKLVKGSAPGAPDHVLALIADNPSVTQGLKTAFAAKEQKIKGLVTKIADPEISMTLVGRVGE